MEIIDYILWAVFVAATVVVVGRLTNSYPKLLDMDPTDPMSAFELEDPKKSDICPVCDRKKGEEPLLVCQTDEKCINKSDTH